MKRTLPSLLAVFLLLGACTFPPEGKSGPPTGLKDISIGVVHPDSLSSPIQQRAIYRAPDGSYTLEVPTGYSYTQDDEEGMYYGYGEHSLLGWVTVQLYDSKSLLPCIPDYLGVRHPLSIQGTNGSTVWGRMDAWDGLGQEGFEFPKHWQQMICKKEGTPLPKEVYVLCSEKNGRRVVMCVSEMKNNPALSKQIFETFRWTK